MMASKIANRGSIVSDSEKSTTENASSHPNVTSNARGSRLQEKEQLVGLNDRLAVYMERVRSLESENARLRIQVHESELVEKSTLRGVEEQYESRISKLRDEFESANREKAKLEMETGNAADENKDLRINSEKLEIEVKLAQNHISSSYDQMRGLKGGLDQCEKRSLHAEKEKKALIKEEYECKKEHDYIRNLLDNEILIRKDLENKMATYKDELEFARRNSNKAVEEFRIKRQSEVDLFNTEVENRYQAKLHDQLQTMRAESDNRIADTRAEMDARYEGKLAKAKEDDDRFRKISAKARQEASHYRMQMENLEKSLVGSNTEVEDMKAKIFELENHIRYLHESNENRLRERDESILEKEGRLSSMMEEYRSLMDVKMQMDTELLAYQKLLEGEENRLNINQPSDQLLSSTPQEDSLPGVIQPTLRRNLKRRRFNNSLEVSQIFKTYKSVSGSNPNSSVEVEEIGTDGSFIRIRNIGDAICNIGGWKLVSTAGLKEVTYKFRTNQSIGANDPLVVWSSTCKPSYAMNSHLVMKKQVWPKDDAMKAVLFNSEGVVMTWCESILKHRVLEENEENVSI